MDRFRAISGAPLDVTRTGQALIQAVIQDFSRGGSAGFFMDAALIGQK